MGEADIGVLFDVFLYLPHGLENVFISVTNIRHDRLLRVKAFLLVFGRNNTRLKRVPLVDDRQLVAYLEHFETF